jgi:membrane protease YdiL (CAAX protease family)
MSATARPIVLFLLLAFGLAWLFALPLWLGAGLGSPLFTVVAIATMFTPAIAALVMVFLVERPASKARARALGLWPLKPAGRFIRYLAVGLVVPIALVLVALPIGAAFGVYRADLVTFSGFQQLIDTQVAGGAPSVPLPIGALVALQFVAVLFGAFINVIPALGEELGWRGWLLPRLLPLGTVPALLVSGVIWGLWHAPLVLLGYNYGGVPGWLALTMMVGVSILLGSIFGWLRLRSASVWPAALAHGSLNAAAGFSLIFAAAGESIDTTQATILGWTGWLVPLAVVAVLVATKQFTPSPTRAQEQSVPALK